jgi:hypothetical protein
LQRYLNLNLVAHEMNFNNRHKITRYPTTVVMDENRNLINYFKKSGEIDFQ